MIETVDVKAIVPTEKQYAWTFGGVDPIARIKPGDVLDLYTEDCFGGKVRSATDLFSKVCEYPYVNPQTGPFFVEGAEPGDTLAIHLIDVQPARDWAASVTVPLFGALTGTHYTQTLHDPLPEKTWIYQVDKAANSGRFQAVDSKYERGSPLAPFRGTVGVAPAAFEARNVLVPEAFGGNMDTPEAKAGATIYLGVNVPGALFSLGDGHYTMGEGETCGVAVEGAMNTVLTVEVVKGVFAEWPRLENDDWIMVAGSYRPLEDAVRIAHTQIVQWIAKDTGLSIMDTYQLEAHAPRSRSGNACRANYTIVAKVPKRFLPSDIPWMSGGHQQMRNRARAVLASRQ